MLRDFNEYGQLFCRSANVNIITVKLESINNHQNNSKKSHTGVLLSYNELRGK